MIAMVSILYLIMKSPSKWLYLSRILVTMQEKIKIPPWSIEIRPHNNLLIRFFIDTCIEDNALLLLEALTLN